MATDSGHRRAEPQPQLLGAYLRAQRQLAALSLRQLADMTDVSNAYLSQIERGLHQPSLKVLRSIAGALNLSTESLLSQAGFPDMAVPPGEDAMAEGMAGVGPGSTSGDPAAGSSRDGTSTETEAAIRRDPSLTEDEREALLIVYRRLRDRTG